MIGPINKTPRQAAFDSKHDWTVNQHGIWCNSCGERLCPEWLMDDDDVEFDERCPTCGYPDLEEVAAYHGEDGS